MPKNQALWHELMNKQNSRLVALKTCRLNIAHADPLGKEKGIRTYGKVNCMSEQSVKSKIRRPGPGQSLGEQLPAIAAQWHTTKNGDLSPRDVFVRSNKVASWVCPDDPSHEWDAVIAGVTRSTRNGCPICSGRKVVVGVNDFATKSPGVAAQWHPTKNGRLTPSDVTDASLMRVFWLCEKGHDWQAVVLKRTHGRKTGCPVCAGKQLLTGYNDLATKSPLVAAEWHPTKNGSLTPSDVVNGTNISVMWLCAKDNTHEWPAKVDSRSGSRSNGCPHCASSVASKIEETLRNLVRDTELLYNVNQSGAVQTRIESLRCKRQLDISGTFRPPVGSNISVAIEYDGKRWHRDLVDSDTANTVGFLADGYLVIRIRESANGKSGLTFLPTKHPNLLQIFFAYTKDQTKMLALLTEIRTWLEVRCAEIDHEEKLASVQGVSKWAQASNVYKSVANKTTKEPTPVGT